MEQTGDALTRILNSPESMQKIAEIAKMLHTEGAATPDNQTDDAERTRSDQTDAMETEHRHTGELASLLDGLHMNPSMMKLITTLVNTYGQSDRQTRLLEALRPFTHGKNTRTIHQAIRAVRIAKTARTILANLGEGDHLV